MFILSIVTMKIQKSLALALVAAARLVGASPSCPSTSSIPASFDQSCQNSCTTGPDAGALVGPGVLSDVASTYSVAAIYFGYQN